MCGDASLAAEEENRSRGIIEAAPLRDARLPFDLQGLTLGLKGWPLWEHRL